MHSQYGFDALGTGSLVGGYSESALMKVRWSAR